MQTSVVDTIFKKKNQKILLISFPHSHPVLCTHYLHFCLTPTPFKRSPYTHSHRNRSCLGPQCPPCGCIRAHSQPPLTSWHSCPLPSPWFPFFAWLPGPPPLSFSPISLFPASFSLVISFSYPHAPMLSPWTSCPSTLSLSGVTNGLMTSNTV